MSDEETAPSSVGRGFAWSMLNNLTLRLSAFVVGIIMARVLAPRDFGVYAIALVVQTILMNFAELGLAADLIRHRNIGYRGPTVATLSLVSSGLTMLVMIVTAPSVATALGSQAASPVIQLMSVTIILAGVGVVPYAKLQARFLQSRLFVIDLVSFVISTGLTLGLAVTGHGAMSIAIGRVAAQVVAVFLQFWFASERPRFGWRRDVAVSGIRFGLPLAMAGLLSLVLMNVDNIVVGRASGAVTLGLYALAFNICSWPTTVVGTAIRAVAMPAFARRQDEADREEQLVDATALTFAVVLPIGVALAVLADPVIEVIYGQRWSRAATALLGLGLFGAVRVVFDLWIAYVTARGASGWLLTVQAAWVSVLTPVMYLGVTRYGLTGAGWAHVVVAMAVVLPLFLLTLSHLGAPVPRLLTSCLPPLLAGVPAGLAGRYVAGLPHDPLLALLGGGSTLSAVYLACEWRFLSRSRMVRDVLSKRRASSRAPSLPHLEPHHD